MYWNTKEYMSDRLVKPVLSRANSMKNLGHVVLESRVSNYAADRLDGALNVCDKYVDRYLPAEPAGDCTDCKSYTLSQPKCISLNNKDSYLSVGNWHCLPINVSRWLNGS